MIVPDKNHIGTPKRGLNFFSGQYGLITTKRLIEFAEIFSPAMRILRADFPLDFCQRMQLRRAPPGS